MLRLCGNGRVEKRVAKVESGSVLLSGGKAIQGKARLCKVRAKRSYAEQGKGMAE